MRNPVVLVIAAILALAYYWVWPCARLIYQYRASSDHLTASVEAIPDPLIEKVFVLPSYGLQPGGSSTEYRATYTRNVGTFTVLIVGRNFKSLDEAHPEIVAIATIGGRPFKPEGRGAPDSEDSLMSLEVPQSILPTRPGQTLEVTVTREGKTSVPFVLTGEEVSGQLTAARGTSPVILDVRPVGFNLLEYGGDATGILIVIAGWPGDEVTLSGTSPSCRFRVDGESFDCHRHYQFMNLNLIRWHVSPGGTGHSASWALNEVESPLYHFDTTAFEQCGKERRAARRAYYQNLSRRNLTSGRRFFPFVGQNKNASLPSLAINVVLTLLALMALRPWRRKDASRWVISFIFPVGLQAMIGALVGVLFSRGPFLAPVIGIMLVGASLAEACVPMAQAFVVAILLTLALRSSRHSTA